MDIARSSREMLAIRLSGGETRRPGPSPSIGTSWRVSREGLPHREGHFHSVAVVLEDELGDLASAP